MNGLTSSTRRLLRILGAATVIVFAASVLFGCTNYAVEDYYLTETEARLFAPYHVGDTVLFYSFNEVADTVVVLGIDTAETRWSLLFIGDAPHFEVSLRIQHYPNRVSPSNGWSFDDKAPSASRPSREYAMLTIRKYPTQRKTFYAIEFGGLRYSGDSLGAYHTDRLGFGYAQLLDYFVIQSDNTDTTDLDRVSRLYWKASDGLLAYQFQSRRAFVIPDSTCYLGTDPPDFVDFRIPGGIVLKWSTRQCEFLRDSSYYFLKSRYQTLRAALITDLVNNEPTTIRACAIEGMLDRSDATLILIDQIEVIRLFDSQFCTTTSPCRIPDGYLELFRQHRQSAIDRLRAVRPSMIAYKL